jgi:hypothetical protein
MPKNVPASFPQAPRLTLRGRCRRARLFCAERTHFFASCRHIPSGKPFIKAIRNPFPPPQTGRRPNQSHPAPARLVPRRETEKRLGDEGVLPNPSLRRYTIRTKDPGAPEER